MKSSILLIIVSLSSFSVFAQDKYAEDAAKKFVAQFNSQKYDDIFDSFSSRYQKKVTKEGLRSYLKQIKGMTGGFKSAHFKTKSYRLYSYFLIAKIEGINADFQFRTDSDNKIDFISFQRIGGSSSPPPIGSINK
ncbi:DUF3887 domain-containing protein [Pedobacter lusitanus]|nr:DUF3887 domain-containing protein [Pedobacter lusitanus]